ncbi:tRNA lysidine(34) synthetase TilS [Moraxella osloensis]|uniref:tRNA(Ile)-lysidine synthase n=2 Tax=Faucicola osloensis TaxID=34062 RepID=A0A2I1RIH7_FAUOS|nr:tRNA lysidine(34) synthetase TilS [Moraxella osloensis]
MSSVPMSPVIEAIKQSYQTHINPRPKVATKIYIACSGGRDSMALLFACQQLQLPIHVIHINHKLQKISDNWQQFVEAYCHKHRIDYDSVCIDWQSQQVYAADSTISHEQQVGTQQVNEQQINEQQARTARYHAIIQIAGENAIVALAHHANDQVETLLMNLCQGTGLAGLTGMTAFAVQHEFGKPIWLWRPLLGVARDEISDFVATQHIPYVDDPTNFGVANQRAFLRNQILPLLDERFHKVVQNITRTQQNLTEAHHIVDDQYQQDLALCQRSNGWTSHQQCLHIPNLKSLSQARRFNLLHHWVKGSQKFAPTRRLIVQIEQLLQSVQTDQQAILQWQGIEIRKYRDTLYRLDADYVKAIHGKSDNKVLANLTADLGLSVGLSPELALASRAVLPNESFQLLSQSFHQSFKKLCQRFDIPSWERQFAKVVIMNADEEKVLTASQTPKRLALLLPNISVWLADASELNLATQAACPWQLVWTDSLDGKFH